MKSTFSRKIAVLIFTAAMILSGCTGVQTSTAQNTPADLKTSVPQSISLQESSLKRAVNVNIPQSDADSLTAGNQAFAVDLYKQLSTEDGNLIFSPYSISLAMAMVSAGARQQTAVQIDQVMHFTLPAAQLHPAFNALDSALESLGSLQPTAAAGQNASGQDFQLNIANSLWGQANYQFLSDYLDLLAQNYGAGLRTVNFEQNPEAARKLINDWVSQQTKQKILDLFAPGTIDNSTRLVLANAIYFKASWATAFDQNATSDQPFTLLDGSQVTVPMMSSSDAASEYLKGSDYQAVSLPYQGNDVKMIIVLPDEGKYTSFEGGFNTAKLDEILKGLSFSKVDLKLPKFKVESEFTLNQALSDMGIKDAFDATLADFSGMDGKRDLFISEVIHKAYIATDESGTEAAAATGIAMKAMAILSGTNPQVVVDHPFMYFIYDQSTGSILFTGRVLDPSK